MRRTKNKPALAGLIILALVAAAALVGPLFSPFDYSTQDLVKANTSPGSGHLMGTDRLGRDLFTRVLYGARVSLAVGFLAALAQAVIGTIYGGVAGFFGGRLDNIMMRIVDILYGLPFPIVVILLMVFQGPGFWNIILALGLVYWLPMARMVRGQVLSLKEQDFVIAARALGAGNTRILFRHILPNAAGPILAMATLAVPDAVFAEAFLSFIGLGVAAPLPSWGSLASEALPSLRAYPWQLLFPAGAISITMLALNFLGNGLQEALDPRRSRVGG